MAAKEVIRAAVDSICRNVEKLLSKVRCIESWWPCDSRRVSRLFLVNRIAVSSKIRIRDWIVWYGALVSLQIVRSGVCRGKVIGRIDRGGARHEKWLM